MVGLSQAVSALEGEGANRLAQKDGKECHEPSGSGRAAPPSSLASRKDSVYLGPVALIVLKSNTILSQHHAGGAKAEYRLVCPHAFG